MLVDMTSMHTAKLAVSRLESYYICRSVSELEHTMRRASVTLCIRMSDEAYAEYPAAQLRSLVNISVIDCARLNQMGKLDFNRHAAIRATAAGRMDNVDVGWSRMVVASKLSRRASRIV